VIQDLRLAARKLLKDRAFTVVAVAVLALGIGANTAVFSVASAILFRPLPVEEWRRLAVFNRGTQETTAFSYQEYRDLRDASHVFSGLAASRPSPASFGKSAESRLVLAESVSSNYFGVLGVQAHAGRLLTERDGETPGVPSIAVISHGLWQRLGNDPTLVDQTVILNGRPFAVVGVAPPRFHGIFYPAVVDVWFPLTMAPQVLPGAANALIDRHETGLCMIGRLSPGISLGQAESVTQILDREIRLAHGERPVAGDTIERVRLLPPNGAVPPSPRRLATAMSALLMATVGLVLLIACANIVNLLLARATTRRREIGIRLAIGASRGRLIRQLLTESFLLALLGAAGGLLVGMWLTDALMSLRAPVPAEAFITLAFDTRPDWRVLAFTLLLSMVATGLSGLVPALQSSRSDLVPALKDAETGHARGTGRFGLRGVFVIGQIGVSLMLLVATGLLVRSLQRAQTIDPGFDTANGLVVSLDLNMLGYSESRGLELYPRLTERLASLPGVRDAALTVPVPLAGIRIESSILLEGETQSATTRSHAVASPTVDPRFFRTLGVPIVRGRGFTDADDERSPAVVIVSDTMARQFWPGEDPIDKRVRILRQDQTPMLARVIGVAGDIKHGHVMEDPLPVMYRPLAQHYSGLMNLLVRTRGNPEGVARAVRAEIAALDPNLPVRDVRTLARYLDFSLGLPRMFTTIVGVFGLIGVLLSALGIYGVTAYGVAQRTREIGIRMALGADTSDVLRLVLGDGMRLVAIGLTLGLAASLAIARLVASLLVGEGPGGIGLAGAFNVRAVLSSVLYRTSPSDPIVLLIVTLLLGGLALLASYVPSRRATKVDPLVALRAE
jgi:putative ABC transport system permease protein